MSLKISLNHRNYSIFLSLILGLSLLLLTVSLLKGDSPDLIVSDGNGYYAWIRSLIIDGDLNFANDFKELYFPDAPPPEINIKTPKGLIPNKYPIGMAIVETPGFLLGHLVAKITPFADDGISLPYQIAVVLSLVILIISSFYLFYLALLNCGINTEIAVFFSATALVTTNIIHYIAKEPTMSHATGVALANIIIFLVTFATDTKHKHIFYYLGCGLLIGLLILVRNTNIVMLPLFLYLFWEKRPKLNEIASLIGGMLMMLFLQQLSLFLIWGKPIFNSYQNQGFRGNLTGLWSNLWGQGNGVFIYHPWYLVLVIINLCGLIWFNQNRLLHLMILISFSGLWLINGLWGFAGDSFGHRAFIEVITILSLGAAFGVASFPRNFYQSLRQPALILAMILTLSNIYLWGGYLLQKYPQNPQRTALQAYTWIIR